MVQIGFGTEDNDIENAITAKCVFIVNAFLGMRTLNVICKQQTCHFSPFFSLHVDALVYTL